MRDGRMKSSNIASLGESGLIRRTRKILGNFPGVIRGIGDDAAVLPFTKKEYLLFTTDAVREEVHFTLKKRPTIPTTRPLFGSGGKRLP